MPCPTCHDKRWVVGPTGEDASRDWLIPCPDEPETLALQMIADAANVDGLEVAWGLAALLQPDGKTFLYHPWPFLLRHDMTDGIWLPHEPDLAEAASLWNAEVAETGWTPDDEQGAT